MAILKVKAVIKPKWHQLPEPTQQWVKLRYLPNPYSYDEALLLCRICESTWTAWIPDHGECILNRDQFVA